MQNVLHFSATREGALRELIEKPDNVADLNRQNGG
jgi:hypothetical protein